MAKENPHYEDALDIIEEDGAEISRLRATIAEQAATIARLEGERLGARQAKEAAERRASNHESLWRYVVSGVTALTGVNYDQPSDVTECVRLLLVDAEVAREGRKQAEAERDALTARVRHAWEAGFRLCRSYGDNHAHWDGEQREARWQAYIKDQL